jgi:hypothetical protein
MSWRVGLDGDLPIAAADHAWSRWNAFDRVFELTRLDDDSSDVDANVASKAFVFYDTDLAARLWTYQLQVADVIDGVLTIVPRAVQSAYKQLANVAIDWATGERDIDAETFREGREALDRLMARMHSREETQEQVTGHDMLASRRALGIGDVAANGSVVRVRVDRTTIRFSLAPRSDSLQAEITSQGFLRVPPSRLARDGTLIYSDGTKEWNEYRSADELGKAAATFSLAPLTWDHPPEMVTADNVKAYQVGHIGDVLIQTDDDGVTYIVAPVVITDAGLIRAVMAGECCELSIGFIARVWDSPGVTPAGVPYQFVQTDLEGNHVAVVEEGRAGPICRLALVGDAWEARPEPAMTISTTPKKDQDPMPPAPVASAPASAPAAAPAPAPAGAPATAPELETVEIPGVGPVPMSPMLATVVRALLAQIQMMAPASTTPAGEIGEESAAEKNEDANEDAKGKDMDSAKIQQLQGVVDGLTAQLKANQDGESERIGALLKLVRDAERVLGDAAGDDLYKLKPVQIMSKVIVAVDGQDAIAQLQGASPDYVAGRFHAAMRAFEKRQVADATTDPFDAYDRKEDGDAAPTNLADVYAASTQRMNERRQRRSAS